jgi:hypothetical protein
MYDDTKDYLDYLIKNKIYLITEPLGIERLDLKVLNQNLNFNKISEEFINNGFCVIDNFLDPIYCERLRKFMLTINFRNDIYNSYASVNFSKNGNNIWFRLLTNISDEIKENFKFLDKLNYSRGWSFIHENLQNKSVGKHSDPEALITFNIWCTPNECILKDSEEYNGIVIYDTFNIKEVEKVKKNIVRYKFNRVTIFDSRKIHESLLSNFKSGYENRKINYTFLYN